MSALAENTTFVDLKAAKPSGLGITQLGAPVIESTAVKRGKLHEFIRLMGDDKVGRRYRNIRVTALKTAEGGVESAKVFRPLDRLRSTVKADDVRLI